MIIRSITLKNFRNYKTETFTFHERFNLISGENAQGKTNLLEAIQLLCMLRPFKQVKMEELINLGETEGRIKGEIESDSGLNEVHITLTKGGKTARLNGKVMYDVVKFLGRFNVVTFLPSDLKLVKGTPQDRRRYLDALICSLKPEHLRDLKSYVRALTQRNASLMRGQAMEALDVWDEKIVELGGKILRRRINLIQRLGPELEKNYRLISGLSSDIKIRYRPSFKLEGDFEKELRRELKSRFPQDKRRGTTSVGPHRDLPGFTIDGKDASVFASQGEAKTVALALKASEIELIKTILGRMPILLLDDITSELDEKRKNFLFLLLEEFPGQVFVTATSPGEVLHKGDKKIFGIKSGKAQPVAYR
ncbi:MAG: DNA replication/repair protein RecF [Ignavibacteriales bacterium]